MTVWSPDGDGGEPYMVYGISPETLTLHNDYAKETISFVAAYHPDHYPAFVALMMSHEVRGTRFKTLLEDIYKPPYNPMEFLNLLIPGAIEDRIEELLEDDTWREEWEQSPY